ncbi:MAG: hypothetical protein U0790_28890 [Isosphaeraceae bacterium]
MCERFKHGLFALPPTATSDLPAIEAVMRRSQDAGLRFADATLVHLVEREDVRTFAPENSEINQGDQELHNDPALESGGQSSMGRRAAATFSRKPVRSYCLFASTSLHVGRSGTLLALK